MDVSDAIDSELFEAYSNRGTLRHDLVDLPGALANLNRALELNPRLAEAYKHRGFVRLDQRDYESVIADFSRTVQLDPEMAWAF